MEWHDSSCPRLDLRSCDGLNSCLRCGSFSEAIAFLFPPISRQSDIRLLYLSPGIFEQDIRCEIYLRNLSLRPKYEAVSYTWADETGNDDLCKTIFVSGQPLSVTRNCENALKRIRKRDGVRTVWIDAVCINQNDTNERGHQVQLMPQIYSRAQCVLIYIGEGADDSDFCLDALGSGHLRSLSAAEGLRFSAALSCLLSRQYFSRAWVLQEVALARTATIICGERDILWTQLCEVDLNGPPQLKMQKCNAKDPRDKVYALLGLIVDHRSQGLAADYNLSVKDLYVKIALDLASQHGWTSILCRAGIQNRSIDTLPSWVPDWSHFIEEIPIQVPYDQVGYKAIQYDDKNDSLHLRACWVGLTDDSEAYLFDVERSAYLQTNGNGDTSVPQYLFLYRRTVSLAGPSVGLKILLCLHLCNGKITVDDSSTTIHSITQTSAAYGKAVRVHDAAVRLSLIYGHEILQMLQSIYLMLRSIRRSGDEMGQPWLALMNLMVSMKKAKQPIGHILSNINRDALLEAIKHESRPQNELDSLWRNTFTLDPSRGEKLRKVGGDYELLVDLNDAIWKLLVRCCLWKEVKLKIT